MNPLVVALLMAQRDGRIGDFISLADTFLDETDSPTAALLEMSLWANMLHRSSPSMSLETLAILDEIDGDSLTGADISDEMLDVLEMMVSGDQLPPEAEEILARYDMRPGSSAAMRQLCLAFGAVLSTMVLQSAVPGLNDRRSPDAANDLRSRVPGRPCDSNPCRACSTPSGMTAGTDAGLGAGGAVVAADEEPVRR